MMMVRDKGLALPSYHSFSSSLLGLGLGLGFTTMAHTGSDHGGRGWLSSHCLTLGTGTPPSLTLSLLLHED